MSTAAIADPHVARVEERAAYPERIIYFDGVCVMCNGIVKLLLRLDRNRRFRYASLQGETAAKMRSEVEDFPEGLDTFVYYRDGEIFTRSHAAFQGARELPYPYRLFSIFRVVPAFISDPFYRVIAKIRYRLFGKYESPDLCPLPEPEHRGLFLP
ncbi:MAG: DCC1-like thiol-disulfide oxidoreductase family protein [Myxococcota bacterium]